jgi:DNA-binding response OmpR family regulator
MTLASLLEMHGHELRIAHDGQAALRIAQQFRPRGGLPRYRHAGHDGL